MELEVVPEVVPEVPVRLTVATPLMVVAEPEATWETVPGTVAVLSVVLRTTLTVELLVVPKVGVPEGVRVALEVFPVTTSVTSKTPPRTFTETEPLTPVATAVTTPVAPELACVTVSPTTNVPAATQPLLPLDDETASYLSIWAQRLTGSIGSATGATSI